MAERILKPMDYRYFGVTVRGFAPRHRIFNRYILQRLLGSGGMGVVWLAQDEQLGRAVALKFLTDSLFHDPTALDELKRETRKCLELTHHNIVRVYDFLQDRDWAAISMEYVDGDTLRNLQSNKASGVYEPLELEKWIWQLTDALEYAHNTAKLVHRDLKPANLILNRRGDLKIADFGIARNVAEGHKSHQDEVSGIGTPVYMSPQQMNGEAPTVADDVYSLGTTLYELVTGRPPFYEGDITHQVMTAIPSMLERRRAEFGIRGGTIPKCWEDTVARCLAKRPDDRPASIREVAESLYPQSRFATAMQALLGTDDGGAIRPAGQPSSYKPPTTFRPVVPPQPPHAAATPTPKASREPVRFSLPKGVWIALAVLAIVGLGLATATLIPSRVAPPMPEPEAAHPPEKTVAPPSPDTPPAPRPPSLPSAADLASEGTFVQYLETLRDRPDAPRPAKALDADQIELDRSAREFFNQGKLAEAADAYRTILKTSPDSAHALANLATILARQGLSQEALKYARQAADAQPADAFARITLGSIQHALGQDAEALHTLACAAALDPKNPEVRLFLGVAASARKWPALAERQFLEAIRLDPDYAEAHRNLAVLYATADPPLVDRARKHLDKARALGAPPMPEIEAALKD